MGILGRMHSPAMGEVAARCSTLVAHIDAAWLCLPLQGDGDADRLTELLGSPPDLVRRRLSGREVLYLGTVVDHAQVDAALIRPLALGGGEPSSPLSFDAGQSPLRTYGDAVDALLAAHAVVLAGGAGTAVAVPAPHFPQREISEPSSEFIARGPHAGFVENLDTNIALIRHGLPRPELRWEKIGAGERSGTHGALLYVAGMVRPELLDRIRRHLHRAHPSFTTDAAMLSQWLAPRSALVFPTIGTTERPDRVVAALVEGRVAILVNGSPTVLLIPNVFAHLLHTPSDYYESSLAALVNRLVRLLGLGVAVGSSALLVAVATINQNLIPERLFIAISQARRGVPVPIAVEVLGLEATIEVIREAGVRLPAPVGESVSIIGAVIVGQAAVLAGLISAPAVVIVSLSFIASFVLPSPDLVMALRFLRYPLIVLAAVFGLYGLTWGLLLILIYLCALDSFGVPYLAPLAPRRPPGLQDTLWRRWLPNLRPSFTARENGGDSR